MAEKMPGALGLVEDVWCYHCQVTQGQLQMRLNPCCGHFKFSPVNPRKEHLMYNTEVQLTSILFSKTKD